MTSHITTTKKPSLNEQPDAQMCTTMIASDLRQREQSTAITTIPCEIQMEILYDLLLSVAHEICRSDQPLRTEDLGRLWNCNLDAMVSEGAKAYLLASPAAHACWDENYGRLHRRVRQTILQHTRRHLEVAQHAVARTRLQMLVWKAVCWLAASPSSWHRLTEAAIVHNRAVSGLTCERLRDVKIMKMVGRL